MTNAEILSSTGDLGLDRRTYDRLYLNWRFGVVNDSSFLEHQLARARQAVDQKLASRCVGRFLVHPDTYDKIIEQPSLSQYLEASVPIEDWNQHTVAQMVMFGINGQERSPLVSPENVIRETNSRPPVSRLASERIAQAQSHGLEFSPIIEDWMIPQILGLWEETFGWDKGKIEGLQRRVNLTQNLMPSERPVWFNAAVDDSRIYTVSMAERLDMPLRDGRSVPIVESTEWRTAPGYERRGLMAATVADLHNHVVSDLEDCSLPPLVIAETNFTSDAFRVGWAAGMEVPNRRDGRIPAQMLVQNVEVGDGYEPHGLRDFVFMYLPHTNGGGI